MKIGKEDIIKELREIYDKNGKLTTRMIKYNKKLPCLESICNMFNLKKSILSIYELIGEEASSNTINLSKRKPYTLPEINKIFMDNNCKLITSKITDVSVQKLKYVCSCGNIGEILLRDFMNGSRCKECGIKKRSASQRLDYEHLTEFYYSNGCKLISDYSAYKNGRSMLMFQCKCGRIDSKTYSAFKHSPHCHFCNNESIRGENHYCWKGGVSPLNEYLRGHIYDWKQDSMKECNYKCDISEESCGLVIHHLYNFSEIIKETVMVLNLPIHSEINMYTKEELKQIEDKCLELHYKYGLGICLTDKLHKEFHSKYGQRNNTLEQYLEFKENKLKGDVANVENSKKD